MTLEEQLKAAILERYRSVRAFTTAWGIPYSTMDSIMKRGIMNAGIGTMLKIFSALDLDIESIQDGDLRKITDTPTPHIENTLSPIPRDLMGEIEQLLRLLSPEQAALLYSIAAKSQRYAETNANQ